MKQISTLFFILMFFTIGCRNADRRQNSEAVISATLCAPVTNDMDWYKSDNKAPLFEGLGKLHFPVSTDDKLVQRYFDQGLVLAYGFNHAEAARSFYYATKLDPACAMAHWGFAYVLGPNYNAGMESYNYERAYEACQKALQLSEYNSTDKERGLILALSKRYPREPVDNRYQFDADYADAMRDLYEKYPEDPDIGTLYAESLMLLHPWNLFDKDGTARKWTPEILSTLERIIQKNPEHCGANHYYIHAVESSQTPQRGLKSAELFDGGLVPNAGHLVHMPSHIYIRTGDYHKGTLANIHAINVDSTYVTTCHAQGTYPLAYYPHNQHFMAATATLEGNSRWALYAADEVAENANQQLMKEPGWGTLQHYYTIPYYVYVKFGRWKDILEMQNDVPALKYPTAVLHYARGMAFLGLNDLESAKSEWKSLNSIAGDTALQKITIWDINSVYDLVQIAGKVLRAEILAKEKKYEQSVALLKEAINIEDNLQYDEPPDWFFSVRHNLGAIQLAYGKYRDAVNTYEEDLVKLPKNGWALKGLALAYYNLNEPDKAGETEERFEKAWATADVELNSSVIR